LSLVVLLFSAHTPLDTFPRSFPVDGEVATLLWTCYGETGIMVLGEFASGGVANLLQTCYGLVIYVADL